jgi:hypothetical protein
VYRRKTGWRRQEERRFIVSGDRPARVDRGRVADLVLFAALTRADAPKGRRAAGIAPAGRGGA